MSQDEMYSALVDLSVLISNFLLEKDPLMVYKLKRFAGSLEMAIYSRMIVFSKLRLVFLRSSSLDELPTSISN